MSKAKEYYEKAKFQDTWGVDIVYPTDVSNIIEISRLEGVLLGLNLCKNLWAKGVMSHENLYETEVLYKEQLENIINSK